MPLGPRVLRPTFEKSLTVENLSKQFQGSGYARLSGLFRKETWASILDETSQLSSEGHCRDLVMPGYETPRRMRAIGGRLLRSRSDLLMSLYEHPQLQKLIAAVVQQPIFPCRHPSEFMVLNVFEREGATHGWHFDDPAIGLIIVLDAPPPSLGGLVEYVADEGVVHPNIQLALDGGLNEYVSASQKRGTFRSAHHMPGDAYLLRSDRCMHRVTPIARGARRSVLNLAFELGSGTQYGNSASILYDSPDEASLT